MTTVSTRPTYTAATTARDLRTLMRDQGINPNTLAWILGCSPLRALRLRYGSLRWTLDEVLAVIEACAPASASVPVWGQFAGVQR